MHTYTTLIITNELMGKLIILAIILFLIVLFELWILCYVTNDFKDVKVVKDKEQVNHPSHYKSKNGKECIEEMREKFGDNAVYWFCLCNAFKYEFRAGHKDDNPKEQDLKKAQWYKDYAEKILNDYDGLTSKK